MKRFLTLQQVQLTFIDVRIHRDFLAVNLKVCVVRAVGENSLERNVNVRIQMQFRRRVALDCDEGFLRILPVNAARRPCYRRFQSPRIIRVLVLEDRQMRDALYSPRVDVVRIIQVALAELRVQCRYKLPFERVSFLKVVLVVYRKRYRKLPVVQERIDEYASVLIRYLLSLQVDVCVAQSRPVRDSVASRREIDFVAVCVLPYKFLHPVASLIPMISQEILKIKGFR